VELADGSRETAVDRLRGFALLGILVVNTPYLLTSINGFTSETAPALGDKLAWFTMAMLFQAKSYVVFSFLFGYSLAILLRRVEERGEDGKRVYLRRLAGLALFGVAHALLLFPGDILVLYAVVGLAMVPLPGCRDRTLLLTAGALVAVQAVILAALVVAAPSPDADPALAAIDQTLATGGYLETIGARAEAWPFALILIVCLQGFIVAALFCVGLVCGRRRLLADPSAHAHSLRRLRAGGLGLGLPLQALAAYLMVWHDGERLAFVGLLLNFTFAPVLSAGLVATILLWPRRGLVRAAEKDGRLSLTVYLAESLALVVLASAFGFGLFGLHALPALALAVAVWFVLLGLAALWLRFFDIGPAESLLRAITYWRAPRLPPARPVPRAR
jgi:uncharacterized protein